MSTTSLNFHHVKEASARVGQVNDSKWLALDFTARDGSRLEVTIFSDSPEKLLEAIAAVSRSLDDAQTPRTPSHEGHNPLLQLAGDRCPCERCKADRRDAARRCGDGCNGCEQCIDEKTADDAQTGNEQPKLHQWVQRCRHPGACIKPQCGDFCYDAEPVAAASQEETEQPKGGA
jgi:hypothetical protein